MTKKVHELAKELNISSKELQEKAAQLGISVTSHMSVLSDADVDKIKGTKKETKIVKAEPKKKGTTVQEEPRVTVKAAVRPGFSNRPKPPVGKPVVDTEYLASKNKPPVGKPVVNKAELENRSRQKPPVGTPLPREAKPVEKPAKTAVPVKAPEAAPVKPAEPAVAEKPAVKPVEKTPAVKPEKKPADRNAERKDRGGKKPERKDGARADRNDRGGNGNRNGRNDRNDRNDRKDNPRGNNGRNDRNDRGGNNNRNDRSGNGGARKDRPQLDKIETKPGRRDDSKKKQDKEKNKFDKLERKSLEKQTRKKHNKPKPQVVETEIEEEVLPEGTVVINVPITVAGFCEQAEVSTSKVIMTLMKLGIMANINQNIDEDTVMVLAEDLGLSVAIGKVEEEAVEEGLELFEDSEEDLKDRPPIITVMGHVDHGKTSLLDAIRKTNVTASESGGITQHIGASEVKINGQKIVFLDTPGHEAFTAMRARGAHVTDIAVLVVAADDSVKPQTVESISHAKAAGVPIIVAINKMDKPGANPDRVKQDLTEHGILVEDWGGDVISVPVSAKSGEGIVNLLEMILLQAEMMELRANPNRLAMGSVIEARLDKSKGPVATLLVTNGTLQSGQSVVAGTCSGRIRLMTDHKGKTIKKAGPATAVEILGLTDVPQAGDEFNAVKDDKIAREIAENRKEKLREEVLARNASTTLEKLFSQIQEGEVKELNLIIKGDVQGSVGALIASLEKLNNENVKVNIIHTGVGTVTESDVMLAGTAGAIIIGFNVRPSTAVQTMADRENIQIRTYRVIYDVIDDVENAMKGMLDPEFKEEILGKVEIRTTFKVPGVGIIGGAYVLEGKAVRNAEVRLVRDGIVIHEGKISSLKRFKDDAKEVASGYECGIGIEAYNDIKEGDIIECFHMVEIERK
ncbi:MAG: translation initiation factor IF-2 [Emergencia sp.]|uniref:Translation initiation factor IF-2 n=1 Tax=Anaerotruncus colihominis TaxID=169435 RepID=A0A845QPA8_9FIRM|nr:MULTISPECIES: translation initiation factor IF-2 [Anaerotruncus]MCI9475696.1 translation initiation factor IF-2 [Emergencia sp.]NBH62553.1 translation initiation factor IF-2 [Anaerotruncus colihominis]NCF03208.1 translation initiation factor IF-2 [Anaerotruncus sp. 80]